MKSFLYKSALFTVPILIVFVLGIFLPTTPRASKSLLMAEISKDSLLKNTLSPRVIFVGGSNLSFGLNSNIIKDSLKLNPINTAIHASIGLKYMMDNTLRFIKKGDIIVLIPEYSNFFYDFDKGSVELLRTILDVNRSKINLLNKNQIFNLMPFLPKYVLSKFMIYEYLNLKGNDLYSINSFNSYGDVQTHWERKLQNFLPFEQNKLKFNDEVLKEVIYFNKKIKLKGAQLFVSYPAFQATSFNNTINQINLVEKKLINSELQILGSAQRYKIHDSLMFNTPYHPSKKGLDNRTKLLIEDLKSKLIL